MVVTKVNPMTMKIPPRSATRRRRQLYRPLPRNPLAKSEWTASTGLQYQRISIRDGDGDLSPEDERGNELSFSGEGKDDLLTQLERCAIAAMTPELLAVPSGLALSSPYQWDRGIFSSTGCGVYSQYLPVNFTNFSDGAETLAFNGGYCTG